MTLALQLIPFNDAATLPFLLDSLTEQTDRDWTLLILDNSTEEVEREHTRAIVDAYRDRLPITFVPFTENIGFAGGHQRLFEQHSAELVGLLNPDAILMSTWVSDLRAVFDSDDALGAASGHVLQWDWEGDQPNKTNMVDTIGLMRGRDESVRDMGRGLLAHEISQEPFEVFGVSGCLPMYRRGAIVASSHDGAFFDLAYGSYKEDVDLAYRLRRCGWKVMTIPTVAYHRRAFRPSHWRPKSMARREYLSYRNHWWNLLTHLSAHDMLRRGHRIVAFEAAKLGYMLLRHPSFPFRASKETWARWPALKEKRAWYAARS